MRAYISVSHSKRKLLDEALQTISQALTETGISPFIFVDHYTFQLTEEKSMMSQAFMEIDACDLLIAEVSEKGIGIGVEVGYAKARGKKIIYLRSKESEHSTTVSGASDVAVIYRDINDLRSQLTDILKRMNSH